MDVVMRICESKARWEVEQVTPQKPMSQLTLNIYHGKIKRALQLNKVKKVDSPKLSSDLHTCTVVQAHRHLHTHRHHKHTCVCTLTHGTSFQGLARWLELEKTVLSEVDQIPKDKCPASCLRLLASNL